MDGGVDVGMRPTAISPKWSPRVLPNGGADLYPAWWWAHLDRIGSRRSPASRGAATRRRGAEAVNSSFARPYT